VIPDLWGGQRNSIECCVTFAFHSGLNFYLAVAIAATRYCSGVKRIPEHFPVVIFVSSCVGFPMFTKSLVFSREEWAMSEIFFLIPYF